MKALVQEFMTREVRACAPDENLATAAARMWEGDCGALPVVDGGRVVGVITDRDICMAVAMHRCSPHERTVAETMSVDVATCAPDEPVGEALHRMATRHVRRLPVVVDGRLAGILSLNDVVVCGGESEMLRAPILAALEQVSAHRDLPVARPAS